MRGFKGKVQLPRGGNEAFRWLLGSWQGGSTSPAQPFPAQPGSLQRPEASSRPGPGPSRWVPGGQERSAAADSVTD